MKLVSWNVNGLRACIQKGFVETFQALNADVFCLQEIKVQPHQLTLTLPGYGLYLNPAQRKGYAGTAIISRQTPLSVRCGIGIAEFDDEGRAITAEYPGYFVVCAYVPNSQPGLARIDYRLRWEAAIRQYLTGLAAQKPVLYCGDLNVARQPIDLAEPAKNEGQTGYSAPERAALEALLAAGFTDSFRHLYPDRAGAYSWWSYQGGARRLGLGWRIDYVLLGGGALAHLEDSFLLPQVMGSDHCPVGATFSNLA